MTEPSGPERLPHKVRDQRDKPRDKTSVGERPMTNPSCERCGGTGKVKFDGTNGEVMCRCLTHLHPCPDCTPSGAWDGDPANKCNDCQVDEKFGDCPNCRHYRRAFNRGFQSGLKQGREEARSLVERTIVELRGSLHNAAIPPDEFEDNFSQYWIGMQEGKAIAINAFDQKAAELRAGKE